jgi:hypothetical protein
VDKLAAEIALSLHLDSDILDLRRRALESAREFRKISSRTMAKQAVSLGGYEIDIEKLKQILRDPQFLGTTGGALAGGTLGALSDKEHRKRNALLGALLGGVTGFGIGTIPKIKLQGRSLSKQDLESNAAAEHNRRFWSTHPGPSPLDPNNEIIPNFGGNERGGMV